MYPLLRSPGPALAPFVRSFWHFAEELPHAEERVLPTGSGGEQPFGPIR